MNQQQFWQNKWDKKKERNPNPFAKKVYATIKNKRYKTMLDIGCGDGRDSLYFARKGYAVTAVDFSLSGITFLKSEIKKKNIHNIKTMQQDITKIKLPKNSVDVVYAHLSVHYFTNAETTKFLTTIQALLNKGGIFFVKVKSIDDTLFGKGKKIEENMFIHESHVRHFFDTDYMRKMLRQFTIITIKKTSSTYHSYKSHFIEAVARK